MTQILAAFAARVAHHNYTREQAAVLLLLFLDKAKEADDA